jgi:hypothetical protein
LCRHRNASKRDKVKERRQEALDKLTDLHAKLPSIHRSDKVGLVVGRLLDPGVHAFSLPAIVVDRLQIRAVG